MFLSLLFLACVGEKPVELPPDAFIALLCDDIYCEQMVLDASASAGDDLSYLWTVTTPDGDTSSGDEVQIEFPAIEGVSEVSLEISNSAGDDTVIGAVSYKEVPQDTGGDTVIGGPTMATLKTTGTSCSMRYQVGGCISPNNSVFQGFKLKRKVDTNASETFQIEVVTTTASLTVTEQGYATAWAAYIAGMTSKSGTVFPKGLNPVNNTEYIYTISALAVGETAEFSAEKYVTPTGSTLPEWVNAEAAGGANLAKATCMATPAASSVGFDGDADMDGDGLSHATDCDDNDASVTSSTWYADADADGYGDAGAATEDCEAPDGYVADATDCDDTDAAIYPGAADTRGDGVDSDCDGDD